MSLAFKVSAAVIDFDSLSNGDYVSNLQVGSVGIEVLAKKTGERWKQALNRARVYSTNDFTNDDPDLFANFDSVTGGISNYNPGNVLILQEAISKRDGLDSLGNNPDDNATGGVFLFKFDHAVTMNSIDLFDTSYKSITVTMFDDAGSKLARVKNFFNADTGNDPSDNLYGTLNLGSVADVSHMKVKFNDASGGLDNIYFDYVDEVPEPSSYALMLAGLAMTAFFASRRRAAHVKLS